MSNAPKDLHYNENIEADKLTLTLQGELTAETVAQVWPMATRAVKNAKDREVRIEASGITWCDGAGMALLKELHLLHEGSGHTLHIHELPEKFQEIYSTFDDKDLETVNADRQPMSAIEVLGRAAWEVLVDLTDLVAFIGELLLALLHAIRHPRRVRWGDALLVSETAGVDALPIVALIGFLIGLIMAFQAAIPLTQFAAAHLVADLIALSMLRELGPLMTAIILAGRTGSAFAAELGAMKVNEEMDALKTMGLQPVRFLVVTRVLAAVVVTPMLTVFANLMGLIGGAIVVLSLGYPLVFYVGRVRGAVDYVDLTGGLVKAVVFGVLVAGVGCLRGMQTKSGAMAVGHSTTRAMVSGIVLIAIADGIFAVVYYYLGI